MEAFIKFTRLGIQRSVSASSLPPSTPSTAISFLTIATPPPTPPNRLLPLHARIRTLLRSTCNDTQIPITGRDTERDIIFNFVKPFIDGTVSNHGNVSSSMFISGSPGTGKTALVTKIIRNLAIDHPGDLKVISINCMALHSLDALWDRMIDELALGKRSSGKKAGGREVIQAMLQTSNFKWYCWLNYLHAIIKLSLPQRSNS